MSIQIGEQEWSLAQSCFGSSFPQINGSKKRDRWRVSQNFDDIPKPLYWKAKAAAAKIDCLLAHQITHSSGHHHSTSGREQCLRSACMHCTLVWHLHKQDPLNDWRVGMSSAQKSVIIFSAINFRDESGYKPLNQNWIYYAFYFKSSYRVTMIVWQYLFSSLFWTLCWLPDSASAPENLAGWAQEHVGTLKL